MCKTPYLRDIIMAKIEESADNSVFFLTDFGQYGAIESIRKILGNACSENKLVHIAHGIYVKPKHSRFGIVPPPLETVAAAIAERDHAKIMPTGSTAANIIGLSTQVPMTLNYLTTSTSRNVNIGNRVIRFKRAAPRNFAFKGESIALIVQALKELGKENIGEKEKAIIYAYLANAHDKQHYIEDARLAPQWIQSVLKPIINTISAS